MTCPCGAYALGEIYEGDLPVSCSQCPRPAAPAAPVFTYEDDENPAAVRAAFDAGPHGRTAPPS